ncbi:ABC transporter permease [Paraburkholderia youngii]|uniref:ABC transporter permease n=1 Tax=Paraburkholderia youngii TaxID=2782701 RepID=A0A7Y6K8X9_9BURK|nr:ABC transporter permease [Paraburkholderia youngii]NUY05543.1 ABC transporter permease [Paraburkholderia youngii]
MNPVTIAESGPDDSHDEQCGATLKSRVQKARRRETRKSFLLVLPVIVFLLLTFVVPIAKMFEVSVYDATLRDLLPATARALDAGSRDAAGQMWTALARDLVTARENGKLGLVARRLNTERSGLRSVVERTARRAATADEVPTAQWFANVDPVWTDPGVIPMLARATRPFTLDNYLAALDFRRDEQGSIESQPEDSRIYRSLYLKTFLVSVAVTALCAVLGYPIAYLMATRSKSTANKLMILVLVPFWTSMLVRVTAWMVMLQSQGVFNDLLVLAGVVNDHNRVMLIYNLTGTLISMTHILLPFFILPLYSVMVAVPPSYMRAAQSLGAGRFISFWKVYFPITLPGVGAGGLLVLILALGYYITPALVGGQSGQMISNMIAFNVQTSLNWGLAAALSIVLLVAVLALYFVYNRMVGAENLKMG